MILENKRFDKKVKSEWFEQVGKTLSKKCKIIMLETWDKNFKNK